MLRVKLRYLNNETAARRAVARFYLEQFTNTLISLPEMSEPEAHVWHRFMVRCAERGTLQKWLAGHGVQPLVHYPHPPCHRPYIRNLTI